jgi:excisionase family DNA binding protein
MKSAVRDADAHDLPPAARKEMAARALISAVETFVHVVERDASPCDEWISQYDSPLGRRAHLKAVRAGALPGVKVGRRILVRRSDVDQYLQSHVARPRALVSPAKTETRDVHDTAAALLTELGLRARC